MVYTNFMINPIFKWIDSGNLDSTKRHPALLTSAQSKETFMQQLSQLDLDYTQLNTTSNEESKSIQEKLKQKYKQDFMVTEDEFDDLQVAATLGGLAEGTLVPNQLSQSSSELHQTSQMESHTESQTESQSEQTEFLNLISQRLLQRDAQLNKKLEALPAAQDAGNQQDADFIHF